MQIPRILGIVSLLAVLPLPYKFYLVVRVVLCVGSIFYLAKSFNQLDATFRAGLIAIAIVYNPFLPLHLPKALWVSINIVSGIFLLAREKRIKKTGG